MEGYGELAALHFQQLFFRFGYEVSIRSSSARRIRLECHHSGDVDTNIEDDEDRISDRENFTKESQNKE